MKSEKEVGEDVRAELNTLGKQLLNGIETQWEIKLNSAPVQPISVQDLTNKQKEFFRDIFANIPAKRILFLPEKRWFYSQDSSFSEKLEHIIPDAIILPINAQEIQEVLTIAQDNEIKISSILDSVSSKNLLTNKIKGYCSISLELLQKVLKFSPELEQITVQSGVKISYIAQYLKEQGWELNAAFKGEKNKTVHEWIFNNRLSIESVKKAVIHAPSGTIAVQKGEALWSYLLDENKNIGICSEFTLQIRPLSKYIRKVDAIFKDLKSCEIALQRIRGNGIFIRGIHIIHLHEKSWFQHFEIKGIEPANDLLSSFFKRKVANDTQDEKDWNFRVYIELEEYHYNISAVIVKLKEILHESGAKLSSQEILADILEEGTSILRNVQKYELDGFHLQNWVSLHQFVAVFSELKKQLEKTIYYSANKSSYQMILSGDNSSSIRLDVYFLASKKHRKSDDALKNLYDILNEILDQRRTKSTLHQDIFNLIQQKLDPKSTMLS